MKRTYILIIGIVLLGLAIGVAVLRIKPSAAKGEAAESGKKKEAGEEDEDTGLGKVELKGEALEHSGLVIEEAAARTLNKTLKLNGKVGANEERVVHVQPRFAGLVKAVRKRLGDKVMKGDVLAVVESNESLQPYDVKSEIDGTVIQRDVALGEFVETSHTLFVVADLSTVWVDLNVYRRDFAQLHDGQRVLIQAGEGTERIDAKITYISPFGAENTQTMLARAEIPNNGGLRPGLFVTGEVVLDQIEAPVAVKTSAIQMIAEKPAVFVKEGDEFEAREIEKGEQDGEWVEILSGVLPGEKYAAANSFVLKAELAKAGMEEEEEEE